MIFVKVICDNWNRIEYQVAEIIRPLDKSEVLEYFTANSYYWYKYDDEVFDEAIAVMPDCIHDKNVGSTIQSVW